jgi:hypothetical protein
MTTKRPFLSGIPDLPIDPAQRKEIASNMLRHAAFSETESAMRVFSQIQQRRATRLAHAATALAQKLGPDHPDVIAVQGLAHSSDASRTRMESQLSRVEQWPRPGANEWTVFGTVTDAEGKGAGGLTVRVFDRDRRLDDLLGETRTNESGDFSVVYHERDFKETNEGSAELYVMVSDARGNVVYSSRDSVRFATGRSEYFAIRLGKPIDKPTAKTRRKKE